MVDELGLLLPPRNMSACVSLWLPWREQAAIGMVLDRRGPIPKRPGLSAHLHAFPASICPCPRLLQRSPERGRGLPRSLSTQWGARSSLPAPDSLPSAPWENTLVALHSVPGGLSCDHGGSAQAGIMEFGGRCQKGEGHICLKPVLPGAMLTALSVNNSICPTGWLATQSWGRATS